MSARRIPKREFDGDWPKDDAGRVFSPAVDGCGPQLADIICESCGHRPLANGECPGRCS